MSRHRMHVAPLFCLAMVVASSVATAAVADIMLTLSFRDQQQTATADEEGLPAVTFRTDTW